MLKFGCPASSGFARTLTFTYRRVRRKIAVLKTNQATKRGKAFYATETESELEASSSGNFSGGSLLSPGSTVAGLSHWRKRRAANSGCQTDRQTRRSYCLLP